VAIQKKYKTLTQRTKKLLAGGENAAVDYKKKADGLHAEDLVSFANSAGGGDILIGVADAVRADGSQYGEVVGTDISDGTVLQILNKAISCIPPVSINVFAENTEGEAVLRVQIPSSDSKPHCTQKGVYSVRDGARNRPLQPSPGKRTRG